MMEHNKALFSYKFSEYITPKKLYQEYNKRYHFTLDPCTSDDNPLGTPKFYTQKEDGLKQTWEGERVYCNPPYHSRNIIKWIEKAKFGGADIVVMLLPARTDTRWFHDYLYNPLYQYLCNDQTIEIKFIKGRLKFNHPNYEVNDKLGGNTAPFPSMLAIFKNVHSNS